MTITENGLFYFELTQHLQSPFRSATIGIVRTQEDAMARKQAAKTKIKEADPFGDLMTADFVEKSFKEAVEEVYEQNRRDGLDSYCTIDGKVVAVKPDGTVVPVVNPKKING
ncbi:MAG: hypothetical protein P4L43_11365 [Syntrophobacteraceae bacterium]|nr:hypothetical protein [Syntrophobacteraceae bacterium]